MRLVPNVVDVAAIAPVVPDAAARRALFVGNFSYEPNRNGLRFLLDDVMPRVWAELPDARLRLVGAGLESCPRGLPRVEALGFVDDLADAYAGVSAGVVPLLQGGGTPLKFVEALAYALPVVATSRAAAGLSLEPGRDYAEAGGAPEAFAGELVAVLRGERPGLGREGRELVARSYSVEAVARAVGPRGS